MAKTLQIKELAFSFGGNVRVFSAVTKMYIDAKPNRSRWTYSSGRIGWNTRWLRLQFASWVDDQKQISGPGTSYHEIMNAIEDSSSVVYFYPRYKDGSDTVHDAPGDRYEVGPAWDSIRIFESEKVGISTAAKRIDLIQVDTIAQLPTWASR